MTAALYARISTRDGRQHDENQTQAIERFAAARGWEITHRYIDHRTGSKGESGRDALAELMRDAHAGHFNVVLVFALDRFTREGVYEAFGYLERLKQAGVTFMSVTEEYFTTSGPIGEAFIAFAAWVAKQERVRLKERINAGIQRAKAEGKTMGRPRRVFDMKRVHELRRQGMTIRAIAKKLDIGIGTTQRALEARESTGTSLS